MVSSGICSKNHKTRGAQYHPYDIIDVHGLVLSSLGRIYAFDNEMSNENMSGHQFTIQTLRNKHV